MPLARVSTSARSTSHSPLPPSPRPPTFLPPSHYAEAGGLSPRPRTRNDSLTSSDSPSQYQTQLESRRNSAFMPISSTSDSSFEVGFDSRPVENKRFSISGGGSRSGGSKNKPSKGSTSRQSRLESHMTNLPLVEAQLLPSLRDTIDRMTRPPSRIQNPASPSATNDSEPSLRYSPEPRFQPRLPMTPQPPHTSSESFPSPAVPLTPKPLKSALRAPTPKLRLLSPRKSASSTPGVTDSPRSPAGKGITPIPPTLKNVTCAASPSTRSRSRLRSRTDPGAPVDSAHGPGNPTKPRTPYSSTKSSLTASSIPRPRAVPGSSSAYSTPHLQTHDSHGDDSASDLELRYEVEARDRRSLRVVNGGFGHTSSESESDGETKAGVGFGLGLDLPYNLRSFASKLRGRFTGGGGEHANDDAADRRRKELLGLVNGLDQLHIQPQGSDDSASECEYGVAVSGSGRVDFGAESSQKETPRVMVSSSSGADADLERNQGFLGRERNNCATSSWKRSSLSPAPPPPVLQPDLVSESRERKSPSRSPVIRQTPRPNSRGDYERPDLMPETLRRHSVYHSSALSLSPPRHPSVSIARFSAVDDSEVLTYSPESIYDEPEAEEYEHGGVEGGSRTPHLQARQQYHGPRLKRHSDDLANSDTVLLALGSRLAAAREREALGIPPSASDAGSAGDEDRGRGERLSYMDSGSSLARVGMSWENMDTKGSGRDGDWSFGAEKLFRTLSGRTVEGGERDREYAFGPDEILKGRLSNSNRPISLAFSQRSSASSVYDEDEDVRRLEDSEELRRSGQAIADDEAYESQVSGDDDDVDELTEHSWRSTIPPPTYAAIAERYGPIETHRQEVIHTLCVTEEAFVVGLSLTINLFILPLRKQDSKSYISGVPVEIAKLFDWLEDISNLHAQLLTALHMQRQAQHPVVENVAEAIRGSFVRQLEVYQPYLARLVNVAGTIARLVGDQTSDFGEFVRIQQGVKEGGGRSLESLLVDPVARLGRYPVMFRNLHECTPKLHTDYVSTFALLHSTEMVIKVMTEVKIREDEYELVKSLSQRIRGLPASIQLATRGRRLLFQGQLLRVQADMYSQETHVEPRSNETRGNANDFVALDSQAQSHPRGTPDPLKRSSRLVDAIHEWGQRRGRSGSVKSNFSSSTATSFHSHTTDASSASSEAPLTPSSPYFSRRSSQLPGSGAPGSFSKMYQPPPQAPPSRYLGSSPTSGQSGARQIVQVLVFSDFVVVAGVSKSRYNGPEEWTLSADIGIGKVIGISELATEPDSAVPPFVFSSFHTDIDATATSPSLVLDLLPLDIANLNEVGVVSEDASLQVLYLCVPGSDDSSSDTEELRKNWLAALRQSLQLTLRSISIPGGYLVNAQTVVPDCSILQPPVSQRALPKSPSLIAEIRHGGSSSPRRQEREERGWWSLCFHQVLREFQTRDN